MYFLYLHRGLYDESERETTPPRHHAMTAYLINQTSEVRWGFLNTRNARKWEANPSTPKATNSSQTLIIGL